jgi:uncharacterized protein YecT (DUF1311 family)
MQGIICVCEEFCGASGGTATIKKAGFFSNNNQTNQKTQPNQKQPQNTIRRKGCAHKTIQQITKRKNSKYTTLNSDLKTQNKTACYLVTEFHCYSHESLR